MGKAIDRKEFHDPENFGKFDLGTEQLNKTMTFEFDQAVSENSKITLSGEKRIMKEYTVGNGLTLTNGNQTVILTLQGEDYKHEAGQCFLGSCSFFDSGTVELTFYLKIVKTYLNQ
tara:strand:- start:135 stop:482 length:348 start_codon:yes stop_codon:yes gene_type:complete